MGRTRSEKLGRGVRIRTYASGNQAIDQFHGIVCTEILYGLDRDKKGDQHYPINLKAEIANGIEHQTVRYTHYFPDPRRAIVRAGFSTVTIKELFGGMAEGYRANPPVLPDGVARCWSSLMGSIIRRSS